MSTGSDVTSVNIYFTLDLYDEVEKIYSITETLEQSNIDDGGYGINKFKILAGAVDTEIDFSHIGVCNFLVLRSDYALSVKLNFGGDNMAMVLFPPFPTILSVSGISKIYVSNAGAEAVDLNVFVARIND